MKMADENWVYQPVKWYLRILLSHQDPPFSSMIFPGIKPPLTWDFPWKIAMLDYRRIFITAACQPSGCAFVLGKFYNAMKTDVEPQSCYLQEDKSSSKSTKLRVSRQVVQESPASIPDAQVESTNVHHFFGIQAYKGRPLARLAGGCNRHVSFNLRVKTERNGHIYICIHTYSVYIYI
jgi:hypothetical protein